MSSSCPPRQPHRAQHLTQEKAAAISPVLRRKYQAIAALQDAATGCLYDIHNMRHSKNQILENTKIKVQRYC